MVSMASTYNTVFWFTFAYFFIKMKLVPSSGPGHSTSIMWPLGYLLAMTGLLWVLNGVYLNDTCGFTSISLVAKATLVPWILIFGGMIGILAMAPGWKAPFSNTLGYFVVKMSNGEGALLDILKSAPNCPGAHKQTKPSKDTAASDEGADRMLCMVYQDPTPLFNELTPDDFAFGMDKLLPYMNAEARGIWETVETPQRLKEVVTDNTVFKKLWRMVVVKDIVAEWAWYILTAGVVLATSTNIMMSSGCKKTANDETDHHGALMQARDDQDETHEEERVYTMGE
jgi:hypothetical protein